MPKRRIPAVKPLSEILPKGTEGGKEFARIVDLLLFHDARKSGTKFTAFDDSAGDFYGLDSYEGDKFRKSGTTGYQYKFYPSPLSDNHKAEIIKSLKSAAVVQEKIKLKKWILFLPTDLTNSGRKKGGGDVVWFEGLREKYHIPFVLECWGHKQLQALFIQNTNLCLYYYPELVINGNKTKATLEATKEKYYKNITELYGKIEFIGMSVYKDEASRGIPMENIFIPLSLIRNEAFGNNSASKRVSPNTILYPGQSSVILGDPGSGKSTLLKLLALVGQSPTLQKRCKLKAHNRLPIFVTLRGYADELKENKNLSLLDYIVKTTQANFSLKNADIDFFENALECGNAILLFDGLDELPAASFKKVVRDRIRTLTNTYPGNTTIVSSRIVGYGEPFRFDDDLFNHFRVAKLELPEIRQFITDWYSVRVDSQTLRRDNISSLLEIIKNPDHKPILELAENPLLLTIITLVHRIDAVLPDERVVLYQKCTETLLNTWHKWKYHDTSELSTITGKAERNNRSRIEAIAYWMHCRAGSSSKRQASIVQHEDMKRFLIKHISNNETHADRDAVIDEAENFLEFIRSKAGLLIEVGDQQYSFVHLTFQEYLASSYIISNGEMDGISGIWSSIHTQLDDPRWREVIRLLIAGLKSSRGQGFLVKKLIDSPTTNQTENVALLGGLLLDGIDTATAHQNDIVIRMLSAAATTNSSDMFRHLLRMLKCWWDEKGHRPGHDEACKRHYIVAEKGLKTVSDKVQLSLLLLLLNVSPNDILSCSSALKTNGRMPRLFKYLFASEWVGAPPKPAINKKAVSNISMGGLQHSPSSNFLSVATLPFLGTKTWKDLFSIQLSLLIPAFSKDYVNGNGPVRDFICNIIGIAYLNKGGAVSSLSNIPHNYHNQNEQLEGLSRHEKAQKTNLWRAINSNKVFSEYIQQTIDERPNQHEFIDNLFSKNITYASEASFIARRVSRGEHHSLVNDWSQTQTHFSEMLTTLVKYAYRIDDSPQWAETITYIASYNVINAHSVYSFSDVSDLSDSLSNSITFDEERAYQTAWLVLLDVSLNLSNSEPTAPQLLPLIESTRNADVFPLKLAHILRSALRENADVKNTLRALNSLNTATLKKHLL